MHKASSNHPAQKRELPHPGQASDVRSALLSRLLSLPFADFARAVALLLERLGYEHVTLVGRAAANGATFDIEGIGWDVEAVAMSGVNRRKVIAALKQYKPGRLVRRRMADELRGACLRANASEALLITTSDLPPNFARVVSSSGPLVPVRAVGGEELIDLLIAHRVGVWEEAGQSPSDPARYGLDEDFFRELQAAMPKARRVKFPNDRADGRVRTPSPVVSTPLTITVRINTA